MLADREAAANKTDTDTKDQSYRQKYRKYLFHIQKLYNIIQNMETGQQKQVTPDELIAIVKE